NNHLIQKTILRFQVDSQLGGFSLEAEPGQELVVSFLGYNDYQITISTNTQLTIDLEPQDRFLDEVVVVAYGTQKKKVSTGSISSVKADQLDGYQVPDVLSALDGQVSGVVINTPSGQPGTNKQIFIRGISTNGDNTPLYVIDGFVGGDINNVNPADIQSIDVLKDAASTAIYGARAANGVIIITTKNGTGAEPTISYEGFYASSDVWKMPEMLNSAEYIGLIREKYANNGATPPANFPTSAEGLPDTDWMDAVFNSAPTVSHRISASFGKSYLSLEYWDQDGIVGGDKSNFQRINARLNGSSGFQEWLNVDYLVNITRKTNRNIGVNNEFGSVIADAFYLDPMTPLWDVNNPDPLRYGFAQSEWGGVNPLSRLFLNNGQNHNDNVLGKLNISIEPIKGLKFNSSVGAQYNWYRYSFFTPDYDFIPTFASQAATYGQGSGNGINVQAENFLNYKKEWNGHDFDVVLGTSFQANSFENLDASTLDLPYEQRFDPSFQILNGVVDSLDRVTGGRAVEYRIISTYGRLLYDYQDKYLLSATIRRDGSSNFGVNNRFGIFPAFSLGWVISEESFFPDNAILDFFKIRSSWGVNGSDRIPPLSFATLIQQGAAYTFGQNENVLTGSTIQSLPNPNIKWEESVQFDVGFDASFLKGRVSLEFDYFNKTTRDLLGAQIIPRYTGVTSDPISNLGEFRNRGIEVGLKYRENLGDLNINVGLNYSTFRNEVTKIPGNTDVIDGVVWPVRNTAITRMQEGLPVGHFVGYTTLGIFQSEN
ncbi:MAG: SusC/RagA family TonB-linked outer membrane protein, partial [Bacteroidota bacterium]